MVKYLWLALVAVALGRAVHAQDFIGPNSIGSQEPLFSYDDQERWKHGYLQELPFYHGHHSFRPYNYHHVFSQSQTAAGWGMSPNLPYSQQFWHRYEQMTDLSGHHYQSAVTHPIPMQLAPQVQYVPVMVGSPPRSGQATHSFYDTGMPRGPVSMPGRASAVPGAVVTPAQFQPGPVMATPGWSSQMSGSLPAPSAFQPTAIQTYLTDGPTLP